MRTSVLYCSYHPGHRAMVHCAACRRPLCPSCDHRIRGFPYCQDCIVRGIDMLRRPRVTEAAAPRRPRQSPALALLCALIPGLGAVYNHQNVKAIIHFLMIIGLIELADVTGIALFGIGGGVFYLFSLVDAYRTAQAINAGLDPRDDDERLRELLRERVHVLAVVLIGLGVLFIASDLLKLFNIALSVRKLWPVIFVVIGLYLLYRHSRRRRSGDFQTTRDFWGRPASLFVRDTGSFNERSSDNPRLPPAGSGR